MGGVRVKLLDYVMAEHRIGAWSLWIELGNTMDEAEYHIDRHPGIPGADDIAWDFDAEPTHAITTDRETFMAFLAFLTGGAR